MKNDHQDPLLEQSSILERISVAVARLHQISDAATEQVEALEKRLLDIEPGVAVWSAVLLDDDCTFEDEDGTSQVAHRTVTLGFAKTKKKWGIAVREQIKGKAGKQGSDALLSDSINLLRKADRELRVLAAPHLDQLLEDLAGAVESLVDRLAPPRDAQEASTSGDPGVTASDSVAAE